MLILLNPSLFSLLRRCLPSGVRHAAILLLGTVAPASMALADTTAQCSKFSHYVLSMEWSKTFCRDHDSEGDCHIPQTAAGWIIHGLWPDANEPDVRLGDCQGPVYSERDVTNLISKRQVYWPDLFSKDDETSSSDTEQADTDRFWKHEWQTHGVCALACDASVTSIQGYFALALNLAEKIDMDQVLQAASIEPSDTTPVLTQDVVNAVKGATRATPGIACDRDKEDGSSYLSEIRLCLRPADHELIDCPSDSVSSYKACPAKVIYPETLGG